MDAQAEGKILLVRILTAPLRLSHVQFVVEDRTGRAAVLRIEGVPRHVVEEDWWPIGGIFAIPNPLASSCSSSTSPSGYLLRLSSPSLTSLTPLSPFHPLLRRRPFTLPSTSIPSPRHWLHSATSAKDLIEALRGKADEAKKEGRWSRAREALTWALEALEREGIDGTEAGREVRRADLRAELAEAHLALGFPFLARQNAADALSSLLLDGTTSLSSRGPASAPSPTSSSNPSSPAKTAARASFLLARANIALQRYDATITALDTLPPSLAVERLTSLSRRLRLEQLAGPSSSRLRELYLRGNTAYLAPLPVSPVHALDLADDLAVLPPDWVHPSLSLSSLPGKNLSVRATTPIPAGTLLMLCRPLVYSFPLRRDTSFTAGLNAWTRTLDPPSVVETSAQLAWRWGVEAEGKVGGQEDRVGEKVEELWAGVDLGRVDEGEGRGPDKQRCEGAVTFNGFVVEDLCSAPEPGGGASGEAKEDEEQDEAFFSPLSVYPASIDLPSPADGSTRKAPGPSAINHSCVPSCSYTFLAVPTPLPHLDTVTSPPAPPSSPPVLTPLFLLRARRSLTLGEELTIDYVSCAHSSLEDREAKLGSPHGHGFICTCGVCLEERKAGPVKREKRARLESEAWELADRLGGGKGEKMLPAELERLFRRAEQIYQEISDTYSSSSSSLDDTNARLPRPPLYGPARLRSLVLSLLHKPLDALRSELEALEALGAVFDPVGKEGFLSPRLKEAPKVRDTDAVLSALWGAWVCQREVKKGGEEKKRWEGGARNWLSLARQIESCQAGGVELFDLRYGGWMGRKGLPVDTVLWRGEGGEGEK